jgi:N-acetylglucosamine-6-phosphate deacetylase
MKLKPAFAFFTGLLFSMQVYFAAGQIKIQGLDYQTGKPVEIEVRNGTISKVKSITRMKDSSGLFFIAPGLFDNQVNGYAGVSFSLGGGELTREGILKATRELWKKGITSYLATLTTNSREVILKNLGALADAAADTALWGSIAGFHIEGPYISPVDGYRGAHPAQFVRKPDWEEFQSFLAASDNLIKTVTLAPETEGAMDFILKCKEKGITVAIGHHNANKREVDEAVRNGARISTHLGNGCANMINRHDNPLWPQLANDGLMASLICDGFHLRDEEISTFFKVKGTGKTIITSDVTAFAGLSPGTYKAEGGETIELTPEGMLRYPAQNVLYGSASPLSVGVVHMMKVTGCSLGDAIRMASTNPSRLYGLTDRGVLEPGKRADIILFTVGEKELSIMKTFVQGKLVYMKN